MRRSNVCAGRALPSLVGIWGFPQLQWGAWAGQRALQFTSDRALAFHHRCDRLYVLRAGGAAAAPRFERPEMRTFHEDGLRTFLEAARTPYYPLFYLTPVHGPSALRVSGTPIGRCGPGPGASIGESQPSPPPQRDNRFRSPQVGQESPTCRPATFSRYCAPRAPTAAATDRLIIGLASLTGAELVFSR